MMLQPIRTSLRAAAFAACAATLTAVAQSPSRPAGASTSQPASQTAAQAGTPTTAPTGAPGTKPLTAAQIAALIPYTGPTYDNKYEIYGGVTLMNGQAGQNLPKRYNMGGGEVMGTYWLGRKLGVVADYRLGAGTTPVYPNPYNLNRVLVYQNIITGGVQYRGPKNRYAAIDFHALAGVDRGTFDSAVTGFPKNSLNQPVTQTLGLYSNRTTGYGAAGGSVEFNRSGKVAFRVQPDITFEHFGTELREFFALSGGVVYRIGRR